VGGALCIFQDTTAVGQGQQSQAQSETCSEKAATPSPEKPTEKSAQVSGDESSTKQQKKKKNEGRL
jgi:hypothetical protein